MKGPASSHHARRRWEVSRGLRPSGTENNDKASAWNPDEKEAGPYRTSATKNILDDRHLMDLSGVRKAWPGEAEMKTPTAKGSPRQPRDLYDGKEGTKHCKMICTFLDKKSAFPKVCQAHIVPTLHIMP